MTMRPDDHWEEGPSVSIASEVEEAEPSGPGQEAEAVYYRPQNRPEEPPEEAPKPRAPFTSRLIYTLIFSIIVLSILVVYALFAGDRIERIGERQEALWGPKVEALENRLESVEERLKLLEERPKPIKTQPQTDKK